MTYNQIQVCTDTELLKRVRASLKLRLYSMRGAKLTEAQGKYTLIDNKIKRMERENIGNGEVI